MYVRMGKLADILGRAIQYAKAQGLRVLGIDGGKDKGALCAKLGVDAFIDFTTSQVHYSELL
jgi:alcohol dehydrogenase, propanol-preferring